jgi:putative tricarboxylic transport membrane protein
MDRWVGGGLVLTALLLYFVVVPAEIVAPRIQVGGGVGGIAASPLFFPRLMAALLGMLGIVLFVRGHSRERNLRDGEGFAFDRSEAVRIIGTAAILIAYMLLLETIGYLLLTPVTLIALCAFLGYRRWFVVVVIAAVFTVLVYVGFRYGMKILLPEGLLD